MDGKSPYSELTPGKISDELLKALGLPENGIPLHVYRMRKHGYPQAWLEEAKDEYSGISIFTAPNQCTISNIIRRLKLLNFILFFCKHLGA